MNGKPSDVSGDKPTDPGEPRDHARWVAEGYEHIRAAQAPLEKAGEWRLSREIADALARWDSKEGAAREGKRSGEGVHGENPPEAQVDAFPR